MNLPAVDSVWEDSRHDTGITCRVTQLYPGENPNKVESVQVSAIMGPYSSFNGLPVSLFMQMYKPVEG